MTFALKFHLLVKNFLKSSLNQPDVHATSISYMLGTIILSLDYRKSSEIVIPLQHETGGVSAL